MRRGMLLGTACGAAALAACTLLVGTDDLSDQDADAGRADGAVSSGDAAADSPIDVAVDTVVADAGSDARTYPEEVLADQPVLYLRLEETVGPSAKDEVSATPSSYFGAITYGLPGAYPGSAGVGIDGGSAYVLVGERFHFEGVAPFTLEGWLRPSLYDTTYRGLMSHHASDSAGRQSYALFVHATDGVCFERYVDGAFKVAQLKNPMPNPGEWHHIVGVYDGATLFLYVDGVPSASETDTRSAPATPTGSFSIGRLTAGSESILGTMDEVAIYDKALPAARVLAHFSASRR